MLDKEWLITVSNADILVTTLTLAAVLLAVSRHPVRTWLGSWLLGRRAPTPSARRADRAVAVADDRLARLEHTVEAIAVEVERITEHQRYATRLLAERHERPGPPPGVPQFRR